MANYSIDDIEKMLNKHKNVTSNTEHTPSKKMEVSKRLNKSGSQSATSGQKDASGKQWYNAGELKRKQDSQRAAKTEKKVRTRSSVGNALSYYNDRQKDSLSGMTGVARQLKRTTAVPTTERIPSLDKSSLGKESSSPVLSTGSVQRQESIPVLTQEFEPQEEVSSTSNPLYGALSGKMSEEDRKVIQEYASEWLRDYNRRIASGSISQAQAAKDATDETSMYATMVRLKNKTNPLAAFVTGIMDSAQNLPGVGAVRDWIDNLTPGGNPSGNFIDQSIEDARTQSPLAQGAGNLAMEVAKYNLASGIMSDIPRVQAAREALSGRIASALSPGGNAAAAAAAGNRIPELVGGAAANVLSDLSLDTVLDTLPRAADDVRAGRSAGEVAGNVARSIGTNLAYNVAGEGLSQIVGRALRNRARGTELDPPGSLENGLERSGTALNEAADSAETVMRRTDGLSPLENIPANGRTGSAVSDVIPPYRVAAESVDDRTARLTEEIPTLRDPEISARSGEDLLNGSRSRRTATIDGRDVVEESYGNNIARGRVQGVSDEIQNEFIDNPAFYEVLSNEETLQRAQRIYDSGSAESQIYRLLDAKSPEAVPLANKIVSDMIDSGRKDEAVELLRTVSQKLREGGQFTQAAAITMMKSDPDTALRYAVRDIDNMNAAGRQKFGNRWTDFSLTDDEIEMFGKIKPGDTDAIKKAYEKIGARLAKQYPSTRWEKFVELSRVGMLLNPRTQIRNIVSNALLQPVRSLTDRVSALGQNAIHLINPDFKVTQSLTGGGKVEKKLAREVWDGVKESLLGSSSSKWDSGLKGIAGDKQVFKGSPISKIFDRIFPGAISRANAAMGRNVDDSLLETVRNFTYYLLEAGDEPFVRNNFVNRLASYMKAQGITSIDQIPEDAITLATDEALKATFKDDNALTRTFSNLKKNTGKVGEIVMPFTKTPANLAMRGIDYSPVGLVNAFKMVKDKKGASEIMDYLAKNLTGTAAIAAGYALAKNGIITGALSSDKDEAAFQKQQGELAYSLKIGDNYYTYDWAQPAAIPFILGASMYQSIAESEDESKTAMDRFERAADMAGQAAVSVSNSWLELSPLQSRADMFDTGNGGSVPEYFINVVLEFPQRFIPSALGAAARTVDPVQRQTFSADRPIQTQINTAISKIPFLSETLPAAYDTWGQEIRRSDSTGEAAFAQMVNPGQLGNSAETPIDGEIQRLFDETGNNAVFPRKAEWKVGDTRLTNEQYSALQRAQGILSYELAEGFVNSPEYEQFDDAEKSEILGDMYSLAKAVAENEQFGKEMSTTNQKLYKIYNDLGVEGIVRYNLYKGIKDEGGEGAADNVKAALEESNMSLSEKQEVYAQLYPNTKEENNPYTEKNYETTNATERISASLESDLNRSQAYSQLGILRFDFDDKMESFTKALAKHEVQGTELSAENQKLKTIYDNDGADGLARYYLYKKNADADGNGSLRKDEIIPYLDSLGLSQQEKRTYFSYLSSAKNPY